MSEFKYGDACQSGDDKYVIAQFRSDASLAWVHDLRSFLNLAELKYKDFHPRRHHVMSNAEMWAAFNKGVQQAEITIVDPRVYRSRLIDTWLDQRAEPGIDFDRQTLNEEVGLFILELSPLSIANRTNMDWFHERMTFYERMTFNEAEGYYWSERGVSRFFARRYQAARRREIARCHSASSAITRNVKPV
jgi:hypothetical protein